MFQLFNFDKSIDFRVIISQQWIVQRAYDYICAASSYVISYYPNVIMHNFRPHFLYRHQNHREDP